MRIDCNRLIILLLISVALFGGCKHIFSDPAASLADALRDYTDQLSRSPSPQMTFHYPVESEGLTTFLFLPNASVTTPEIQAMKLPLVERITGMLYPGEMIILQKSGRDYSFTTVQKNFIDPPDRILGVSKTGGTLHVTLQKVEGSGKPRLIAIQ